MKTTRLCMQATKEQLKTRTISRLRTLNPRDAVTLKKNKKFLCMNRETRINNLSVRTRYLMMQATIENLWPRRKIAQPKESNSFSETIRFRRVDLCHLVIFIKIRSRFSLTRVMQSMTVVSRSTKTIRSLTKTVAICIATWERTYHPVRPIVRRRARVKAARVWAHLCPKVISSRAARLDLPASTSLTIWDRAKRSQLWRRSRISQTRGASS